VTVIVGLWTVLSCCL